MPDDDSGGQVEEAFAPEKPHRGLIGVDVAAMLVAVFVGDARDDSRCCGQAVYLPSLFRERRVRGAVRSREGRGRSLSGTDHREVARYWAGLPLLVRLSEAGTELSSGEIGALLGTRSVKGIGAALSGTRDTLFAAGIRMDEAAIRRTARGRSVWTGGPRIRQAIHVLEQERYLWTESGGRDVVPIEDARSGDPGPVLVLRALKSRGNVYRIDGGMAELDEILEDGRFEIGDARRESIGEIFVARIEPGRDGRERRVPDGYGENGIWVRGEHDYAEPRVAGAIGTGLWSTMIAWVGEPDPSVITLNAVAAGQAVNDFLFDFLDLRSEGGDAVYQHHHFLRHTVLNVVPRKDLNCRECGRRLGVGDAMDLPTATD